MKVEILTNHLYLLSTCNNCLNELLIRKAPLHTHFRIRVLVIVEDPTVTVRCRTAIKVLFLYLILCPSVG